jgi:hypothetical protein
MDLEWSSMSFQLFWIFVCLIFFGSDIKAETTFHSFLLASKEVKNMATPELSEKALLRIT